MNAIGTNLIEPTAANSNAVAAGASQASLDNGRFAALMVSQAGSSSSNRQAIQNEQGIGSSVLGTESDVSGQPVLPTGTSQVDLRFLKLQAIQAPHHDPVVLNDGTDTASAAAAAVIDSQEPQPVKAAGGSTIQFAANEPPAMDSISGEGARTGILTAAPKSASTQALVPNAHQKSSLVQSKDSHTNTPVDTGNQQDPSITTASEKDILASASMGVDVGIRIQSTSTSSKIESLLMPKQVAGDASSVTDQATLNRIAAQNQDAADIDRGQSTIKFSTSIGDTSLDKSAEADSNSKTIKESSKKTDEFKGAPIAQDQASPSSLAAQMTGAIPWNRNQPTGPEKQTDNGQVADISVRGNKPKTPGKPVYGGIRPMISAEKAQDRQVDAGLETPFAGAAQPRASFAKAGDASTATSEAKLNGAPAPSKPEKEGVQADAAAGNVLPVAQAGEIKAVASKSKYQAHDHPGASLSSDEAEGGVTSVGSAPVVNSEIAAPQNMTGSHTQAHTSISPELAKGNTATFGDKDNAGGTRVETASANAFTAAQPIQVATVSGTRNQQVEVGFHDGTLGWLSVRATAASDTGGLHLSVSGRSTEAAAAVDRMLPSLQHFLQQNDVRAHSVTLGSQESAALPAGPSSMATSSFSQNARNASEGDQRNNSSGQQGSNAREQQSFTQKEREIQPRAYRVSAGSQYEGSLQDQGLLSIRI